ncbi:hypothetical protein [Marisediminicola sp. LYQ134]|uniref:hypothetical protein n=1 Tax=Marisediminicola sp. LYQ134 TaxID=3391061 RepID=UPI0039833F26
MHVREWRPPWPPIYLGGDEWIIMRDSAREPAAVVRALRLGPRNELFYRVVRWAAQSSDRELVGYFPDLDTADRAVLFTPELARSELPRPVADRLVARGATGDARHDNTPCAQARGDVGDY